MSPGKSIGRAAFMTCSLARTLALLAVAGAANAGFIDERKGAPAPPPPAAAPIAPVQAPAHPPGAPKPAAKTPDAGASAVAVPAGGFTPAGETKPYVLAAGKPVHTQLIEWANSSGWVLKWSPEHTWEVFADTTILAVSTDRAVEQVVQNLRMEGKPIRLRVYVGNRVMEVEALTVGDAQ